MAAYLSRTLPPRPGSEANEATYPSGFKALLATHSPTGISPTYDLLDGYWEPGAMNPRRGPAKQTQMNGLEHPAQSRKMVSAHNGLPSRQGAKGKSKPDKKAVSFMCKISLSVGEGISIDDRNNKFLEHAKGLIGTLEDICMIHPVAEVAVYAFKTAIKMEQKRRQNDKKTLTLCADMGEMMTALAQLGTIEDKDEKGPDGVSIESRLKHLIELIADDIKKCSNACEAYRNKLLVVRIVVGSKWEAELVKYTGHFLKRRSELEFALSVHTGVGIAKANAKLDELGEVTKQIQERMEAMFAYFQASASQNQEYREMAARIKERGGNQAVMENEVLLKEFAEESRGNVEAVLAVRGNQRGVAVDVEALKLELTEDIEAAMDRNMEKFSRKFEMLQKQIVDELSGVVHREGDRIIDAVTAGPHDRIIDPDLHAIWKEMGWRGSTKARHFVLALRDYFRERMEEKKKRNDGYEASRIQEQDEWALEWINVTRLQPIVEAFDDDASHFITIAEANDLTTARPRDWSLLHWLAYWAIGWQISATMYRDKINHLFAKMFSLKAHIHPAVRSSVDTYLHTVWTRISELTSSIEPYYPAEGLREKFQSYMDDEERRLREALETIRYDIDTMDTFGLVTGPGRIEKYVFPMLYLLLKKDYEVMRLARKKVINNDELWDAADTICWVLRAVDSRYKDLQEIFRQQKLDARQQLKSFACGLFEHWCNSDGLWSRNVDFPDHVYNDGEEAQGMKPADILNYPLDSADLFDPSGYDAPRFSATELDTSSKWPLRSLLGSWCGFLAKGDVYPCQPMLSIRIHAVDSFHFQATSRTPNGTTFHLRGKYESEAGGRICYTFEIKYAARFDTLYFRGYLYDRDRTFVGTWGVSLGAASDSKIIRPSDGNHSALVVDSAADRFIFKRLPATYMCCRPDPIKFQDNKPRALWKYATTAVRELLGMRRFSWSYFKRRRDIRRRYIELLIRLNYSDLDEGERMELARIRQTLTTADARLYQTLYDYELRTIPIHLDVSCDHCESAIIGPRIICLDCDSHKTVNLCDDARCRDSEVGLEKRSDLSAPHLPGHAVFKVRAMVHLREFGQMDRAARAALKKARTAFDDVADLLADELASETAQSENANLSLHRERRFTKIARKSLSCLVCKKRAEKPCWCCISCQDDVFICLECDAKGPLTIGAHDKLHPLVRCQDAVQHGPLSVDQRLELIEHRFETMEDRFAKLEKRVVSMDDKLTRMEEMLGTLFARSINMPVVQFPRGTELGSPLSPVYRRPLPTPSPSP